MKISAKEEYGLRCLLQLAQQPEGRPMTVAHIAEKEGLSLQNTAKIMHLLRKASLIKSLRGIKGGFVLARPAAGITVWEILERLSGGMYDGNFCSKHSGDRRECVHLGNCGIRPVWAAVMSHVQGALSRMTLAEVLGDERKASREVEAHFKEDLEHARSFVPIMMRGGKV